MALMMALARAGLRRGGDEPADSSTRRAVGALV